MTMSSPQICSQITVADVRDGACALQHSGSSQLGQVSTALEQMVYAEATSVPLLLASDAYHRGHWKSRESAASPSCSTNRLSGKT
jgi:deoxyhypusine synthase